MTQITSDTLYGDMQVGDLLPDGGVISHIDRKPSTTKPGVDTIALTVRKGVDYKGHPYHSTFGAQFADITYGQSLAHADYMRATMPKYSD